MPNPWPFGAIIRARKTLRPLASKLGRRSGIGMNGSDNGQPTLEMSRRSRTTSMIRPQAESIVPDGLSHRPLPRASNPAMRLPAIAL
jgi:hypothetical protein